MAEPVEVDGVKYDSLKDACNFFDINIKTVKSRLGVGMSLEEALTKPLSRRNKQKVNSSYDLYSIPLSDVCVVLDINPANLMRALKSGISLVEYMDTKKERGIVHFKNGVTGESKGAKDLHKYRNGKDNKNFVEVHGIEYPSLMQACIELKKNYYIINRRILNGYSIEDAFNLPYGSRSGGKTIKYNGVDYHSMKEACIANKIAYSTFHSYYKTSGLSHQEAFDMYMFEKS